MSLGRYSFLSIPSSVAASPAAQQQVYNDVVASMLKYHRLWKKVSQGSSSSSSNSNRQEAIVNGVSEQEKEEDMAFVELWKYLRYELICFDCW